MIIYRLCIPSYKRANLIKERNSVDVSPSQIILKHDLNIIGSFKVEINFHTEVKSHILIKIDKIQSK